MKLSELPKSEISQRLKANGLTFRAGRFKINLQSTISLLTDPLFALYSNSEFFENDIADFHVKLAKKGGLVRAFSPQVQFYFNGLEPFSPLPYSQTYPLLEWGLNWCVTKNCNDFLVIHAAVVEKNGLAIILPGEPGSGKSTLCAALVSNGGWRLLSDELALVSLTENKVYPNPRPVSLKNQSISIIKQFAKQSTFSPSVKDTIKGEVAHMMHSPLSSEQFEKSAIPAIVLFPKYQKNTSSNLCNISKGETFLRLAENSFNYNILGVEGFNALGNVLDNVSCYQYTYDGNLTSALSLMDDLITE